MVEVSKKRATLTGITLNVLYPDGTPQVITLDPKNTVALFWSDETVLQIFAPFYDNVQSEMTKEELVKRFGRDAGRIAGRNTKIKITKEVVEKLWNLPDNSGILRPFLGKSNDCLPS